MQPGRYIPYQVNFFANSSVYLHHPQRLIWCKAYCLQLYHVFIAIVFEALNIRILGDVYAFWKYLYNSALRLGSAYMLVQTVSSFCITIQVAYFSGISRDSFQYGLFPI